MAFLFWRLVEESKASGAEIIYCWRSELNNEGLIAFKDRLGTKRKLLTYYRYTNIKKRQKVAQWDSRVLREFFCSLPDAFLSAPGKQQKNSRSTRESHC